MHVLEISILVVYLSGCIGIGLYSRRRAANASSRSFLTAGESIGWVVNGMAVYAAFATGGTMLGNMGLSYSMGWGFMMTMNMGVGIGFVIVTLFIAKPFRNLRIATVPEFMKIRFDSKIIHVLVPVLLICTITAYVVAQMKVAGMIGEQLLGIPYMWSVVIIGFVYVFYTAIGGMWAITLTDFFQGVLMLFIAILGGILALNNSGGFPSFYSAAQTLSPAWTNAAKSVLPMSSFVGAALIWATCLCVLPHTIMRVFSAKDERSGRKSLGLGLTFYFITCIFTTIFITAAAIILSKGGKLANGDAAFLTVIDAYFPSWLKGITYAAIFAAVMSSVSAMLLSIAAAVSYDLVKTFKPSYSEKTIKSLNTACIWMIGILAVVLSMNPPAFLTLLYSAAVGLLASGLFWPVILGLWWKRMNKYGALASLIAGAGSYLFFLFGMKLPALSHICYSLPVALIFAVVVSLLTAPPSKKEMERLTIAHEREYELVE